MRDPWNHDRGTVAAMLGPTNTGKTYYAVERMLGRATGVIGFPLRLLAREVYDRIVAVRGPKEAALITGEEKIVPAGAKYYICTVESMPLDWGADFVAVDEIQLCADLERGHVFTDRLLNARGRQETLFLGSATMRDRIAALIPTTQFLTRDRLSKLSYAGSKKVSRLPPRTAIVAFSAENVYAIAELIRRQKGGAAVVMGALSPRTRNAQVALFQDGDVDYLVATDAIGMGLNLDVKHVYFAGASKFDGRRHRPLDSQELAQIAGRAGRYMNDGLFGVTGEVSAFDPETVAAIEDHRFTPVRRLQWRNSDLDFATPAALLRSLEREPPFPDLVRARDGDDMAVLRLLSAHPDVAAKAKGRAAVKLLWDVCQLPDFRKTMASEHADLVGRLYAFLTSPERVIPDDWLEGQIARIDRPQGDIDILSKRLAYIRTWTYVANRADWTRNPEHWREQARAVEDRLSDALHTCLTQRFVDRRTSVLMRRLKQKEELMATVEPDGVVMVEGEFVGRIEGLRFQPDKDADGVHKKTLQEASQAPVAAELNRRIERLYNGPDTDIDFTEQGGVVWDNVVIGRLEAGADPFSPKVAVFVDDILDSAVAQRVETRLTQWIGRRVETLFEPLLALKNDETVEGIARGVAFQMHEAMGIAPRHKIANDVKALDQDSRSKLRKHGVRFGQHTVFFPALLKPAPTRLRVLLWGLASDIEELPAPPPPGLVTITAQDVPAEYYPMAGYRLAGARAIRIDMLERVADHLRQFNIREGFEATPELLSITGLTLEQFADLMGGLGFVGEKLSRPKAAKPAKPAKSAKPAKQERAQQNAAAPDSSEPDLGSAPQVTDISIGVSPEPEPEAPAEAAAPPLEEAQVETEAPPCDAPIGEPASEEQISDAAASASEVAAEADADAAARALGDTELAPDVAPEASTEANATSGAEPEASAAHAETASLESGAPSEEEPSQETASASETLSSKTSGVEAAAPEPAQTAEPAAESAEKAETAGKSAAETQEYYLFKLAPRRPHRPRSEGENDQRPRRSNPNRGPRDGAKTDSQDGEARQSGRRPPRKNVAQKSGDRPEQADGRPPRKDNKRSDNKQGGRHSGKQGGKQGGRDSQKPREYTFAPRKDKAKVDPDSPFAVLQQLKDRQ